ncbi:TonB-dependent siderophore receptor [Pararobbsia silviterrae]|uniref:TonB-dependent siderophore receptor n=1 Tax=Pararobbsia silviterrae TaxID=1792498 RepID=A0A494YBX3_9BURK|nr:TonB-dependent receptor [Pararobbsia silviterrae]RKP57780.1 TonB-dependent siderophore receptor [Pararobbsia silviterrae]
MNEIKKGVSARTALRRTAAAWAVAQMFVSLGAYAQDSTVRHAFHLPAGTLESTLLKIAQEGGQDISFDTATVAQLKSVPIEGTYTTDEAIDRALAGSGLERVTTASGAVAIRKSSGNANGAKAGAVAAGAPAANASAAEPGTDVVTELPLVSVQAQRDSQGNGYISDNSTTATRTDTPVSETPQSITVLNSELIQQQNAQTISEVVRNASGVQVQTTPFAGDQYTIRGYAGSNVLSNGLPQITSEGASSLMPTIGVASVEILKGPSAILAGTAEPGGVVNIVKKTPDADPFHEVQLGVGSFGELMAAIDSTGALTDDKKLQYRLIMSVDGASTTDMGYDGKKNFYFSPSIRWKDADNDFILNYTRTVATMPFPSFTYGANGSPVRDIPDSPIGNASDHFGLQEDDLTYTFEHDFDSHLSFTSKGQYTHARDEQQAWGPVALLDGAPNYDAVLLGYDTHQVTSGWAFDNYLTAKYSFGKLKSVTMAGFDYVDSRTEQYQSESTGIMVVGVGDGWGTAPNAQTDGPYDGYTIGYQEFGGFIQQQFEYERLHILASIRASSYWAMPTFSTDAPSPHETAYTPNVGVLYDLTDWVSAYANYMRGFYPSTLLTYPDGQLPPQQSKQIEAGFKFHFFDDKLQVTTSAFRQSYTNAYISDPEHYDYYLAVPGMTNRGFEIDVSGSPLRNVNMVGSYTYLDSNHANMVTQFWLPHHTASLWTTYNFDTELLHGLGVGVGLFYTGRYYVGDDKAVAIGSQVETDLGVFYKRKQYTLNLSVKNLFNRYLYGTGATDPSFIPLGPSRTVMLTGAYDF